MLPELAIVIRRELTSFEREIALFPDDASVWKTVPGLPNSAGTLTLHICGNLRHFIGTVLGGTGYVRQRDLEFSRWNEPRSVLLDELRTTADEVIGTLEALTPAVLDGDYPIRVGKELTVTTPQFLLQLAVHLSYHLGQVDYARRAVTGDAASADNISLAPLAR